MKLVLWIAGALTLLVALWGAWLLSEQLLPFGAVSRAKEAVGLKLSDPLSAQFRGVGLNVLGEVCGEVNAKNKMGGYVGFVPFSVVAADGFVLWHGSGLLGDAPPPEEKLLSWRTTCRQRWEWARLGRIDYLIP